MKKKIITHLKKDIKAYAKQRKNLRNEAKEDKELISSLKKKGKKKNES